MNKDSWNLFVLAQEKNIDTELLALYMDIATQASKWWSGRMHIEAFTTIKEELDLLEIVSTFENTLRDEILKLLMEGKPFGLYYIAGNASNALVIASEKSGVKSSYPNNSVMEISNNEIVVKEDGKKTKKLFGTKGVENGKKI